MTTEPTKTLPELIAELKDEFKEFTAARLAMLHGEVRGKVKSLKFAATGIIAGSVLVATGWLLFTAFLICAIANGFASLAWRYAIASFIVGVLYSGAGFIVLAFAWQQVKHTGVKPERTIRVLKQDQIWLQSEVKTQL